MLKNAGGIPDGLSLHHFAFNGHKLVVKYLLNMGVKDTFVQGTPSPIVVTGAGDKELNITPKVYIYDNHHLHSRETALHATVRREHLSVIKVLLTEDLNSINCTNSARRFPQHEAVYLNIKFNSLEALLHSGASAIPEHRQPCRNLKPLCLNHYNKTIAPVDFLLCIWLQSMVTIVWLIFS